MEVQLFILYVFAAFGAFSTVTILWQETSNLRYNFELQYILKPKFKTRSYVLVPGRGKEPTLARIKSVSKSWYGKKIEYTVYPTSFANKHVDYEYFEQLVFVESDVWDIESYYKSSWDDRYKEVAIE